MEEKLAMSSYNNPSEMLNKRSEKENACKHKKKPDFKTDKMWVCVFYGNILFSRKYF